MTEPDRSSPPDADSALWAVSRERDLSGKKHGDFEIERLLGHGGMGEVYLARQVSLGRPVALKFLRPDLVSNATYLSRFEAEALAAAKLNHPNIVHIYTLGSMDDVRFIAMEYVQGTNLREYISKKGIPDLPLALSIMKQAGQAVGAAGEVGLVHRDIKPENLLLTKKGQVKVADFGLARAPESDRLHLTQKGVTLGTPLYMSPEQAQGNELDHRSDLYSLGITFYHMLAGFPPFRAENGLALALKHVRDKPVSLSVHRPDLPLDLTKLVMKLMEKDPADRFQTAAEMLRELSRVRDAIQAQAVTEAATKAPVGPREALPSPSKSQGVAGPDHVPLAKRISGFRPSGRVIALLSVAGLAVGGLLGWSARAQDLLAGSAPQVEGAPGLWIVNWRSVERKRTAEEQYEYALFRSTEADRVAAWLAVPGYFPNHPEWTPRAYIQLARNLFKRHDRESLRVLAAELKRATAAKRSVHGVDKHLAQVIDAAESTLEGDPQEARDLGSIDPLATDPALVELMLEVTVAARDTEDAKISYNASALRSNTAKWLRALQIDLPEIQKLFRVG
jgi:eukaryotic-like serine/threonine-protein kinase